LGASGVLEIILSHLMLEACADGFGGAYLDPNAGTRRALTNSFGFGGANVSIIIEQNL
jgi:3-oxoacyl-(acyl-carrier-protein) synthase